MTMLSEHLSVDEIKCRCGCGLGTHNELSNDVIIIFELIRRDCSIAAGHEVSITVNSGCRCIKHHKEIYRLISERLGYEVPAPDGSRHLYFDALDLVCPKELSYEVFYNICVSNVGNLGGIGKYTDLNIVHIDTRGFHKRWGK